MKMLLINKNLCETVYLKSEIMREHYLVLLLYIITSTVVLLFKILLLF